MGKKKVLFISQEVFPFLPKSEISETARNLAQGVQENGKEIRVFMPRFGVVNERRHQLHEVIRLSGMNLIINDKDHPLLIKVASISSARMQVYFIDNEEYFKRKFTVTDADGKPFEDNGERSMFFCRGVLETVKKLGWQPDVIFCTGWMTALLPVYLKTVYKDDPHFTDTKVIYNLCGGGFEGQLDKEISEKLKFDRVPDEFIEGLIDDVSYEKILSLALSNVDGVCVTQQDLSEMEKESVNQLDCDKLENVPEEHLIKEVSTFIDKVIGEEVTAES